MTTEVYPPLFFLNGENQQKKDLVVETYFHPLLYILLFIDKT